MSTAKSFAGRVHGYVSAGFEAVREAFAENFARRKELRAACAVYHRGEKVVDLWGGVRDIATGEPWEEDTMTLVFSTTKGMAAATMALAHSRGWLDYDERVSTYWPEFAQNGKEQIQSASCWRTRPDYSALTSRWTFVPSPTWTGLPGIMARQKPEWETGTRQAYHAISLGFYQAEIIRRG